MHEFSITKSIVDILEKNILEKNLNKIIAVNFEVSSISQIEPESIKFYYEALTENNPKLKGAKLNFKIKKIRVKCNDCGKISEINGWVMSCPDCKSKNINLVEEDEIKIVSVETEK